MLLGSLLQLCLELVQQIGMCAGVDFAFQNLLGALDGEVGQIGRASCRERVYSSV